ncbi:uncharacterized protein LOC128720512 [Anopheles nili]|uniref:uncharacterized protein LOC128720512 n=1 Tax=Anopheles nili TaxID=185578 RepID=UPI00237B045D|nr:uncharacterized protein LOC128720512 [Anopheles nili]
MWRWRVVFAVLVVVTLTDPPAALAICTASVPSDQIAGCAFNPLLLLVERSGWVLSRQNCGETVGPEAFEVPPVVYYDYAEPDHLYTVALVEDTGHGRFYLQWLVANIPGSSLVNGMTYMDGDTIADYLSLVPRSADDDAGVLDGQPTRYGFYLYEQVYGTVYPSMPNTRQDFDLDGWIGTIYPAGALCGPVASIGFGTP